MCIIGNAYIKIKEKEYEKVYLNTSGNGQAVVISNKKEGEYSNSYIIKKEGRRFILKLNKKYELDYGDLIGIEGEYQKPETARNYKGFDYSIYLKSQDLYGMIIANKVEIISKKSLNFFEISINKIRLKIIENSKLLLGDTNEAGLLIGLLIGDKELIEDEIINSFKDSSLSHVLAISGQHISYIVLAVTIILKKVRTGKIKSKIIIIFILIFFMLLVGFSPSIFRAGLMGILLLLSELMHKKSDFYNNLAISMLFIFLINPFAIYDIGLWLSYGGTLGIVIFSKSIDFSVDVKKKFFQRIIDFAKGIIKVSMSAQIIIIPIILINFNKISLLFLISNLLASPIVALCIILGFPLMLISFIQLEFAKILVFPIKILLQILIFIAEKISNIPFSNLLFPTPNTFFLIVYYLCLIIFIYHKRKHRKEYRIEKRIKNIFKKHKKPILLTIIIVLLLVCILQFFTKELQIYFIDVGQGDCTLIVTKTGKTVLIDGGGSESYNVGENILIPYLLDRGISKLDYIIISHFDTDHVGGVLSVIEKLQVEKVIIGKQTVNSDNYEKFKEIIKKRKIDFVVAVAGTKDTMKLQIEKDVYIEFLWPNIANHFIENTLNNESIICKFYYKNFSILFTGDIEEMAEKQILENYKNSLRVLNSTILKIAHHGSKTSSTQEFLSAVKPQIALIGVGENNKFGHPNDSVIERLENMRDKNI